MDTISARIAEPRIISLREMVTAYIELTKPRIAIILVLTSAAGFYLGSTGPLDLVLFGNSVFAILLLAFGVATLNQYWERDLDQLMDRTAGRPLPTARVTPMEALVFGIIQCVLAEI